MCKIWIACKIIGSTIRLGCRLCVCKQSSVSGTRTLSDARIECTDSIKATQGSSECYKRRNCLCWTMPPLSARTWLMILFCGNLSNWHKCYIKSNRPYIPESAIESLAATNCAGPPIVLRAGRRASRAHEFHTATPIIWTKWLCISKIWK